MTKTVPSALRFQGAIILLLIAGGAGAGAMGTGGGSVPDQYRQDRGGA